MSTAWTTRATTAPLILSPRAKHPHQRTSNEEEYNTNNDEYDDFLKHTVSYLSQ